MDLKNDMYRVSRKLWNTLKDNHETKLAKAELIREKEHGSINVIYSKCIIDEEWIRELEEKIPYVEKAIEESRHELKKEGNVVRIDQVRKVSPDSIKHLAQHSDLITDMAENMTDVIPEKLYVTENSDNYMLYENRFLYTLLVYLRDFVESRYSAISHIPTDVREEMELKCDLDNGNKKVRLNLTFSEEFPDEGAVAFDANNKALLERIDNLLDMIVNLQNKPLMKQMADQALLTLPIVATNIIKSNPNFNEAYKLLDYVVSYTKPGYEVEETAKEVKGLSNGGCEDIASIIAILDLTTDIEAKEKRNQMESDYLESRIGELSLEEGKLLDEMRKHFEAESLKKEQDIERRYSELLIAKDAQIDAIRARFNDFSEEDHMDGESFKRLTAEKKAFDRYYDKKWAMIKKKARKEYIWDQLKKK